MLPSRRKTTQQPPTTRFVYCIQPSAVFIDTLFGWQISTAKDAAADAAEAKKDAAIQQAEADAKAQKAKADAAAAATAQESAAKQAAAAAAAQELAEKATAAAAKASALADLDSVDTSKLTAEELVAHNKAKASAGGGVAESLSRLLLFRPSQRKNTKQLNQSIWQHSKRMQMRRQQQTKLRKQRRWQQQQLLQLLSNTR